MPTMDVDTRRELDALRSELRAEMATQRRELNASRRELLVEIGALRASLDRHRNHMAVAPLWLAAAASFGVAALVWLG